LNSQRPTLADLLLSAVRWFWDHGHWDVTDASRKWDFVGDPVAAQLDLEEFLDKCARAIEAALVASLYRGPLDPAAAAVALRALALRVLGRDLPAGPSALDFVLGDSGTPSPAPSTQWAAASAAAQEVLARIGRSWVAAFATARQGDTGDPQAVDTARLTPALERVKQDLGALLALEPTFDEAFNELQQQWDRLCNEVRRAAEPELQSVGEMVDVVVDKLAGIDLVEALPRIKSASKVAADNGLFRPRNLYAEFASACDRLAPLTAEDIYTWSRERQDFRDGADAMVAAVSAQRWTARVDAAVADLAVLAECLQKTKDEVEARLVHEIGETPQQVEARIRSRLASLKDVLATLGADQ
jgi:hypothetical protein